MKLLDEQTRKQLLEQYPENCHELLLKQLLVLEDTLAQHLDDYQNDSGFRKAIQLTLIDIVQGKYLGRNPMDN